MAFQGQNLILITGYVAKDPDVYETEKGTKVANFSIPTNRKWGDKVITDWHNCVAWGKLADVIFNFVSKGSLLQVSGQSITKAWEDKNKVKHNQSEILVEKILLLGGKKREEETTTDTGQDVPF